MRNARNLQETYMAETEIIDWETKKITHFEGKGQLFKCTVRNRRKLQQTYETV